jgi:SAM-dependent methyltransferase
VSAIFALFDGLDRAGPGDGDSLRRAVALAGTAPGARVLDAGCGPGADAAALAEAVPGARIVAVDTAPAFAARVKAVHPGVRAEVADLADPPGGPFDMIWSAGAVYTLGVTAALRAWRAHLAPGGRAAFSHLGWRERAPPEAARAFRAAEGAVLTDAAGIAAEVAAAGWRVIGAFRLPRSAWAAYHDRLARRLDARGGTEGETAALVALFRAEIALWRAYGGTCGYRMVVAEPV